MQTRAITRRNTSDHVLTISITSSPCCDLDTTSYFGMPISKRRRLRILNLSVRTRLSTDKSSFYSTCPENATFPRTKCSMRSLLHVYSPLILIESCGHQFTAFGGNFLAFGIIGDCTIGIKIHIHHDIRLVELDGLACDGVVHE